MRRHHWILLALLLVAFALRLAYWQRSASFGQYELSYDDDEYFKLGILFSHGEFFRDPYPYRYTRAPGYPLFLAPTFAFFGPRIEIALAFQVFVSVLMVSLTYVVARRAFGMRAGLAAGALMALAPIYASPAGSFLFTETLFSFLILLFIYLWWRWTEEGLTLARAGVAGLILGYSALVRPSALYFLPIAALWFLFSTARRGETGTLVHNALARLKGIRWTWAVPRLALLTFGTFALILPYTARNNAVYRRYLLIDSTGGWTLWRDHRVPGDDFWTTLPAIPNPADRDRYAAQRGMQNILANPGYQLGLQGVVNLAATMRLELDSFARGAGYLSDVMVDAATLPLVLANDIYYLGVVLLGLAGILVIGRRAPKLLMLWLAYFMVIVFVYHTQSRFRTQYTFVLTIFAGAALARGPRLWHALSRPARFAWVGTSVLVLLLAYSPLLLPLFSSEYYLAQAQGRDISAAQNAVKVYPGYAKAYDTLGDTYRRAGDLDHALQAYSAALKINPYEMQAHLGRMDVFRQQGDTTRLEKQIKAAGVDSGDIEMPAALWWSFDPAPTRLIELGDSTSSFGYVLNFFAPQLDGKEPMRFSRDHSFLKFPGVTSWKPTRLVLYARAFPLPNQPLPKIGVYLNGRAFRVPLTADWRDHEIPLDDALRAQDTLVVEFRSPTFRPSDVLEGSDDPRDLGFLLGYAELR